MKSIVKVEERTKEEIEKELLKGYGASTRKTTDEQLHKVREEIAKEILEDLEQILNFFNYC